MPSCPVHGTPMNEWPSGDFFCPKKVGGRFCDVVVRADGTVTQKSAKLAPDAPRMTAREAIARDEARAARVPTGLNPEQDLRAHAALAFASRIYSGTEKSHEALELARSIVRNWAAVWEPE